MGNWQLEVAKMALYVAFPVALFHYFNQSESFAEWATKMQTEINPPQNEQFREEIKRVAKELKERDEERLLKAISK